MVDFIGRETELALLQRFVQKPTASLIVIRGRRRIGKSRLVEEFAKPHQFIRLSGIPPTEKTTAQSQRDEFANQLSQYGFPSVQAQDWNDLFLLLTSKTGNGRIVVLFDEISWMGSKDPDFLGKLKNMWDLHFKNNSKAILILCGSASSWINENILSNTGFVGRVSFTLTLEELPLHACQAFWGKKADNISAMEKLKILAVTGGVPRYLEELNPKISAEDNIRNLCFTKGALLVDEFDHIFSHVFLRESNFYQNIIRILAKGNKEYVEICHALGTQNSGRVSEYLNELELAGFITRDHTWHLHNHKDSKLGKFRLSDNYLRFYVKYIEKYKTKIERNSFDFKSIGTLPRWDSMLALQFENLVLANRPFLWKKLGLRRDTILSENPFFQKPNTKQKGCQIDYMVQTNFDTLYICEIKFSRNPVPGKVIEEIQDKIARLKKPKHLSCRPVLIHINGVEPCVEESGFFSDIIDFSEIF